VLDVGAFADDVTVPSFGPRMVCTMCGAIGADARRIAVNIAKLPELLQKATPAMPQHRWPSPLGNC
jgi:hypothetical protein